MSFRRWFTAKEILGEALEAPADLREKLVQSRCGDDETLRGEVLAMLSCHTGPSLAPVEEAVIGPGLPQPGSLVGSRYRVGERIGIGAFGRVHRAEDERSGVTVAVKLIALGPGGSPSGALRRELAALRRARLPGVVELLDDGIEEDFAFVVMRLVGGREFPGRASPVPWRELAPLAGQLLRALESLHAVGVLHRDIKPANVLVGDSGQVTLVDLGVALDLGGGDHPQGTSILGTPTHMAPELFDGRPATIRSDIYAVGVMLWEALTGRTLHDAKSVLDLAVMRASEPAPPLETVVEDLPGHVAEVVARLLAIDPAERPNSVRRVRRVLAPEAGGRVLPRLGAPGPLHRAVDAVREHRPLDVVGAPGTGRSRLLRDAAAEVEAEGYRVEWARPSDRPLGSIESIVGEPPEETADSREGVVAWAATRLRGLLDRGIGIFADDAEDLDPVSGEVLAAARAHGAVVRAGDLRTPEEPVLRLDPLSRDDLKELFSGPDRIFHVKEDASAALWTRTHGVPSRIADRMDEWERSGTVRREGSRYSIARAALDAISRFSATVPPTVGCTQGLGTDERQVAGLLEVARAPLLARAISRALDVPEWRIDEALDRMEGEGLLLRDEEDRLHLAVDLETTAGLSDQDRASLHLRLSEVLPEDSEAKVDHLVAADRVPEAAVAACEVARSLIRSGEAGRAHALLGEVLCMLRRESHVDVRVEETALELLLTASLAVGTVSAIDALVYQLERSDSRTRLLQDIELLARAALATVSGDAQRALSVTDVSTKLAHDGLDKAKHVIRTAASRTVDPELSRSVLAEALAWARRTPFEDRLAHVSEWLGWFRYRELEFGRAAALHARAARRWRDPRSRVSAWLNAASASMEAGGFDRARMLAEKALQAAAVQRYVLAEARAEWLLRCIGYRSGRLEETDHELLEVATELGASNWLGLFHMTEAAIAWRAGRALQAADLAKEASRHFEASGKAEVALLMRALAAAAGHHAPEESRDEDVARLKQCRLPRIRAQAAALFALSGARLPGDEREECLEFISKTSADTREQRCEVLSLAECRVYLKEEK